ncbi:MAG: GTPase domain-containing protein [Planctomycetes bacterium]|nr:GTPase domain-containing protein [Planctomycetota bacterium]
MPSIDVRKKRIDSKIVYYGPGRAGKTENLRYVYHHLDEGRRGPLSSLPTKSDPNLQIDVLPVRSGNILGFRTIFHLCAGPGQAFSTGPRRLLLRESDGIVFVADSRPERLEANLDSLAELEENLQGYGLQLRDVPHVIQYCKCDLPGTADVGRLRSELNHYGVPDFTASTETGEGVMETLQAIVESVGQDLQTRL